MRSPKALTVEVGLKEHSPVESSLVNGELVVALRSKAPLRPEQLPEPVTEENMRDEVSTGPAAGREGW